MNLSFPLRTPHRKAARRLAPVLAASIAAAGLVAAGNASPAAAAADSQIRVAAGNASPAAAATSSPIRMVAATTEQNVQRWPGEDIYLYDLGLFEVADQTFEIRTTRAAYNKPIVAKMSVGQGTSKVTTTLPDGLMKYADHIPGFYALKIKDSTGKVIVSRSQDFCPNSYSAARATPTGAASSPYPYQCGNNPFALGMVYGIARGWSVPALGDYYGNTSFKAPDGRYTLAMAVSPKWRRALGVSAADGYGEVTLKVTTATDAGCCGRTGAAATTHTVQQHAQLEQGHNHTAAAAGTLSPQGVKLEAARLKALGVANTPASAPPAAKRAVTASGPRPDLRSLPAYQIQLDTTDGNGHPSKNTYIDFGATVWNAGPSPLVVDGFRRSGTDLMDAYQYFYDLQGNEVGSAPAGTLEWDPRKGHEHWHFTAFATYQLLDSTQKLAVRSGKEAFCLAPTDAVNLTLTGANWRPGSTDLGTACGSKGALSIREVLDAGWGDTYGQYLPGQSFDITNLANGIYYIQVLANPDQKLAESDTTNNSSLRKIKLSGKAGGKRTIKVYPYQGIDVP